jgi:plasmid stability protein
MTNLTISLDDVTVRDARIKAIQEGTSVSAKVREFLRAYVAGSDTGQVQARQTATARLMQTIADAGKASQANADDTTTGVAGGTLRSALYEEHFRQLARDAALAAPSPPALNKPGA